MIKMDVWFRYISEDVSVLKSKCTGALAKDYPISQKSKIAGAMVLS